MRSGIGDSAKDPFFVSSVGAGGAAAPAGTSADPFFDKVQGTSASGAADDGSFPVKAGGVYRASPASVADGQRVELRTTTTGQLTVDIIGVGGGGAAADGASNSYVGLQANGSGRFQLGTYNWYYNGATWDRARGDTTGAFVHAPTNTVSSALSGTIGTSGATATVAFVNTARQEVINPSAATLWASWGTPAVNGAGSFPIAANGGQFQTDRTAGTLTLLSTAASQPYTVNRYS